MFAPERVKIPWFHLYTTTSLAACGRQYTYKFAGKIVKMISKMRGDTMRDKLPIEVGVMR